MKLSVCIVLFGLSVLVFARRRVLKKRDTRTVCGDGPAETEQLRKDNCDKNYLGLIDDFFLQTLVKPSDKAEAEYCQQPNLQVDLKEVIRLYESFSHVESYTNPQTANPVTAYGAIRVNKTVQLPLYMVADIRRHHVRSKDEPFPPFGKDVDRQMKLMDKLDIDDLAFLLSFYLGGSSTIFNFVPMVKRVYQGPSPSGELGLPKPTWKSSRNWIRRFLIAYPHGRVAWNVALQYPHDLLLNLAAYESYRPLKFAIQFTAYTDQEDESSEYFTSPLLSFSNAKQFSCTDDGNVHPKSADMRADCPVNYLKRYALGKLGEEIILGKGDPSREVSFSYTIAGKHYIFTHSVRTLDWFIHEILPNGEMGKEMNSGSWSEPYSLLFPYKINGRQFFYGNDPHHKKWFIQELLPNGWMGSELDRGTYRYSFDTAFPITIGGSYFIYNQESTGNKYWKINRLTPNGKMGVQTALTSWKDGYDRVFPYSVNGRQYIYAHNTGSQKWSVRKVLQDGSKWPEVQSGNSTDKYHVAFPFKVADKYFFYGQNTETEIVSIFELLPDGRMGEMKSNEKRCFAEWCKGSSIATTFRMNGKQYFYGHYPKTTTYVIQTLI